MSEWKSMSEVLEALKGGDPRAPQEIWDRCIHELVGAARKKLKNLPRRVVDEEDVAVSAFDAFFRGVEQGRFKQLNDRQDLWQVLVMLTERKANDFMRREFAEKRGGGLNRGESVFERMITESAAGGIDQQCQVDPEVVDLFTQKVRESLEALDDEMLRRIAVLKLENYTNQEIANQVGIALRSVERKIKLIRCKLESIEE